MLLDEGMATYLGMHHAIHVWLDRPGLLIGEAIAPLALRDSFSTSEVLWTSLKTPKFDLIEEGERRELSQEVRDDICRLALELMRNAYRHADADRVATEIQY